MLLVALGWIYVVLMVAVVEAMSGNGTVVGALLTFAFYGLLPVGLLVYLMLSPARRRARRAAEEDDRQRAASMLENNPLSTTLPVPVPVPVPMPMPMPMPMPTSSPPGDDRVPMPAPSAPGLDPDRRGHAPGDPLAAEGKEP